MIKVSIRYEHGQLNIKLPQVKILNVSKNNKDNAPQQRGNKCVQKSEELYIDVRFPLPY